MPQACRVCALGPSTVKELETDFIGGMNAYQLKEKYGVSYGSVQAHLENHLPKKIVVHAQVEAQQTSTHLLEKIDDLYAYMKVIFQRNFDRNKDGIALKALEAQKGTLELLAKISYALHQSKLADIEKDRYDRLQTSIPIERLTKHEQIMYFQLSQKLMGDRDTIDFELINQAANYDVSEIVDKEVVLNDGLDEQPIQSPNNINSQDEPPIRFRRRKSKKPQETKFEPFDKGKPPRVQGPAIRLRSTNELNPIQCTSKKISPDNQRLVLPFNP